MIWISNYIFWYYLSLINSFLFIFLIFFFHNHSYIGITNIFFCAEYFKNKCTLFCLFNFSLVTHGTAFGLVSSPLWAVPWALWVKPDWIKCTMFVLLVDFTKSFDFLTFTFDRCCQNKDTLVLPLSLKKFIKNWEPTYLESLMCLKIQKLEKLHSWLSWYLLHCRIAAEEMVQLKIILLYK